MARRGADSDADDLKGTLIAELAEDTESTEPSSERWRFEKEFGFFFKVWKLLFLLNVTSGCLGKVVKNGTVKDKERSVLLHSCCIEIDEFNDAVRWTSSVCLSV